MRKRMLCLAAIAAFMLSLAAGCGNGQTQPANNTASDASVADRIEAAKNPDGTFPETVLRVGWPGTGTWTGVQGLTYKLGYFEEELAKVNATIEVTGFAGAGPEINAALTGGSLDAGQYGDVPSVQIKSKGTETTLLGGNLADTPTWLGVTPDIKTVADLKGKKIGVGLGTYAHRTLGLFLQTAGLSLPRTDGEGTADVELVNISGAQLLAAFAAGQVDGFVTMATSALKLEEGSYNVLLSTAEDPIWRNASNTIFRTAYIEKYPQVVDAYLRALIRGEEYAKTHTLELNNLLIEAGTAEEIVNALYPEGKGYDSSLTFEANDAFIAVNKDTAQFLVDNDLTDELVDVDAWLDTSWYDYAKYGREQIS